MNFIDRLVVRLQHPGHGATLIFVSGYSILWGLWLLVFDVFKRAPVYSWLTQIGTEEQFGLAAIIVGVAMALTTLNNRYPWTAYGAALGFVFWGLITTGFFLGDYHSTGCLSTAGVSLYSAFVYLNIRLNQNRRK